MDVGGEWGMERQVAGSSRAVPPALPIHSIAIPGATEERQCLDLARGPLPGGELASRGDGRAAGCGTGVATVQTCPVRSRLLCRPQASFPAALVGGWVLSSEYREGPLQCLENSNYPPHTPPPQRRGCPITTLESELPWSLYQLGYRPFKEEEWLWPS